MDYAPNPGAHLLPPTKRTRYLAPSIAHWPPDSSIPHYNAPPRTPPSLYHYSAPPYDAPPPAHSYTSTEAFGYNAPMPVENLPPTDIPHYGAPVAYSSDTNVIQQSAPNQSYGLSSAYYRNPSSHYSHGYDPYPDPYATHSAHTGSGYSVSGYSYQRPAYQSRGYDPYGYPQVANRATTQYPQYPPAKVVPGSRPWNPNPKHKKPKPVKTDNYCQICKIGCSTAEDLGVHRQGKKHQRNLEKLQGAITPMIGPQPKGTDDLPESPSQPSERKRKSMPTVPASLEELEVKKKRVYDAGAPVDGVRVCGVCNIVVNSQKVFDLHCAGSKHAMMLKRLQEGS